MSLPPLANLFAVHRDDPGELDAIETDLATSGEFARVWRPARAWVAAAAPLPGGAPDSAAVLASGFAFAEGRDRLEAGLTAKPREWLGPVCELVDTAPERLGSLPGDFGFIRFRPDGAATVVRSCGGLAPFYLWQSRGNIAVSTRLGDFVRYLPEELRLDPLVNAVWTTSHSLFPDRRTFLAGVTILDRGCAACLQPGRAPAFKAYWQPRAPWLAWPTPARVREHAERLRALLINQLRRDLAPDGGNLLSLSGGVDSSSLAALSAGVVRRPVWIWSLLPASEDLYRHEMSFIEPLVHRFRIDRHWVLRVPDASAFVESLFEAPRVVFHVIHPALCMLPAIVRDAPVRVLFGGEFGDEICGSGATTPDWAAHTTVVDLVTSLTALPSGPKDLARWVKHRALGILNRPRLPFPTSLPRFVCAEVTEEYLEWFDRRQKEAAHDDYDRRYLALCTEGSGFVTMNWEATSAMRVRRSFPFFTREVLELAFECHTTELVGPGPKKLLRAALWNDVPSRNLNRRDKGEWGSGRRARQLAWQGSLPKVLDVIVKEAWLQTPRAPLAVSQARGLAQLAVFASRFTGRRAQCSGSDRRIQRSPDHRPNQSEREEAETR